MRATPALSMTSLVFAALLCSVTGAFAAGPMSTVPTMHPGGMMTSADTIRNLQAQAQAQHWTFTVGHTAVSDRRLETLTGETDPPPALRERSPAINAQAERVLALYRLELKNKGIILQSICSAGATSWDWRIQGKVTPVKSQSCGDCWAFASVGEIESALLMAGWSQSDLSEQQMLSCSGAGSCSGGTRWIAVPWAISNNMATESAYPYEGGVQSACKSGIPASAHLIAAGLLDGSGNVPPTATLKSYLCQYGPISVSIYADAAMQNYTGGVFNEQVNNQGTNHAILLIGWDDSKQAWLIKNSWSTGWGGSMAGFGWIHYGSNNVGRWPVYAQAPQYKFVLSPALLAEVARFRMMTMSVRPLPPTPVMPRQ